MSTAEDNEKDEKKGPSASSTTAKASTSELVSKYVLTAADVMPAKVKPFAVKAAPYVGKAAEFTEDKLIPFLILYYGKAMVLWEKLQPYKPMLLLPSVIGLIMCFFGGTFLTVIAAAEAYRLCGYEQSVECARMLMKDFQKVLDANKKDNVKDDDGDGIPDVLQVSTKDLAVRKTLLFLKTVNPQRITDALSGINSGLMGVVATLKLKFVKTVTLGNAIANNLQIPADKYIVPHMIRFLPPEYQRWAPVLVSYTIKSIAVSVAWTIQRVISAFHAALTGGLMFSRNIMAYLSEMDYYKINADESLLDEVVGYGIAVLGFFFQLRYGFGLPFPLNVLLFPVTMLEYFLMGMVTSGN